MAALEAVDGVCRSIVGSAVAELLFRERAQVVACGAYLMAYVARCEHAKGDGDGAYTRALRQHRNRYLRV